MVNRDRGLFLEGGGACSIEQTMVSVLHRELQNGEAQEVGGQAAEDQKQIILTSNW